MPDIVNPYIAGSPVTGAEMFFGRQDIFAFVQQTLIGQHRDQVIVLYGQRRTGKTSALYQMSRHLGARYLCIFVDLHGLALEGVGGFVWELANHIARALRRDYQIDLPPLSRTEFMADPRSYFENEFLNGIWSAIGERHVLLMLDEAIRLQEQVRAGKLEKEIFDYLRHLMQHYERLNFLFSLGSGLEEMEKEYALLFNVALYKKISFLETEAAQALITQPVKDCYQVEPAALERILQITSGHPYYTQLLCHSLFNRWQREPQPQIQIADVEASLDEVVERGLAVLKHVWEESTPGEKAALAGMAAAMGERNQPVAASAISLAWARLEVAVPDGQTATALKTLIARDVIVGRDEYVFAVDLQRLWVQKYERLEWVKEELTEAVRGWAESAAAARVAQPAPQPATPTPPRRSLPAWLAAGAVIVAAVIVAWLALSRGQPGPIATASSPTASSAGSGIIPGGPDANINNLAVAAGAVWAATDGDLVRCSADGANRTFRVTGLGDFPTNEANTIIAAADGTLWVGAGGVAQVRPAGDQLAALGYYNQDNGLSMGSVRALMLDTDGSIWAGGFAKPDTRPPLSHYDGKSHPDGKAWRTDEPLMDALALQQGLILNIQALLRSSDGALWLGLEGDGILRWDGTGWARFGQAEGVGRSGDADHRIRRLVQDRQGTIWAAASDQGLLRFDAGQGRWQPVAVVRDPVPIRTITQFADGSLWVAGDGLVARSTDGGQVWTQLGAAKDGIGTDIGAVVQDAAGRVWIGAYNGGTSVFDQGRWRHLQP